MATEGGPTTDTLHNHLPSLCEQQMGRNQFKKKLLPPKRMDEEGIEMAEKGEGEGGSPRRRTLQ